MKRVANAFITGVIQRMRCNSMNLGNAIIYELCMMFKVMGCELYVKYMHGDAVEGVDYLDCR